MFSLAIFDNTLKPVTHYTSTVKLAWHSHTILVPDQTQLKCFSSLPLALKGSKLRLVCMSVYLCMCVYLCVFSYASVLCLKNWYRVNMLCHSVWSVFPFHHLTPFYFLKLRFIHFVSLLPCYVWASCA